MHIPLHVLEEVVLVSKVNFTVRKLVYSVQQVLNGEVGLHGAHVEVNASDQDQEDVMDLDVKDIPKSVIHVQEEVVLVDMHKFISKKMYSSCIFQLVVFGEDGHHGANVEVIV